MNCGIILVRDSCGRLGHSEGGGGGDPINRPNIYCTVVLYATKLMVCSLYVLSSILLTPRLGGVAGGLCRSYERRRA